MAKSKASAAQSQLKSSLRQLHKMGLYDPKHPRREPTRYAKSLVKKYTELGVIGAKPRAQLVAVPKAAATQLSDEFRTVATKKKHKRGAAVIVPKRHGVKVFYSKKRGTLVHKTGVYEFHRYHDSQILLRGEWPDDIPRGQDLAIPVRSGFKTLEDQEEVLALMARYAPGDKDVNFWQWPYIVTRT